MPSHDLAETQHAFELLLGQIYGVRRNVTRLQEQLNGAQGESGSQVRYFDVTSTDPAGGVYQDTLVTKAAVRFERQILQLLSDQHCAVPPVYTPDVTSDGRALVYMPYLDTRPPYDLGHPSSPLTYSVANGLAGIHAANRGQPPSWLPHTSEDFGGRLWLHAWRIQWESNLKQPDFAAEFGAYTQRLDTAMAGFIRTLAALTAEGETLTLLNVDLIPDHIRLWRGEARFIDWEQSSYGSLYLDLPNYFSVESALVYRDALARHGYEIPVIDFLERFREVGRYMGLRYLGHALWVWAQGGKQRRDGRWFLYYTFTLALHGR
jgi:hypothetical protein